MQKRSQSAAFRYTMLLGLLVVAALIFAACSTSGTGTSGTSGAGTGATTAAETPAASVTEAATEMATEASTEMATEAATEASTEMATEAATEASTEMATEAATEMATEAATGAATEMATEAATAAAGGATGSGTGQVMTAQAGTYGTILTDDKGMTLYVFDKDTAGTSTCTGTCAEKWPAFTVADASTMPAGSSDITSTFATIKRDDGSMQVTVNGMPLYYYYEDAAPGDTKGQGVGDVWWVVGADGNKITTK